MKQTSEIKQQNSNTEFFLGALSGLVALDPCPRTATGVSHQTAELCYPNTPLFNSLAMGTIHRLLPAGYICSRTCHPGPAGIQMHHLLWLLEISKEEFFFCFIKAVIVYMRGGTDNSDTFAFCR